MLIAGPLTEINEGDAVHLRWKDGIIIELDNDYRKPGTEVGGGFVREGFRPEMPPGQHNARRIEPKFEIRDATGALVCDHLNVVVGERFNKHPSPD
jgi:hypothetical protein